MAWSAEGYNAKLAQAMKANADPHTKVAAMCRQIGAGLSEYEMPKPSTEGTLAALNIGQEIIASKAQKLDVDLAIALKHQWTAEQEKAKRMIATVNHSPTKVVGNHQRQQQRFLNFLAVRAAIKDESIRYSYTHGLLVGNEQCVNTVVFLEEFFAVCQTPNKAELVFIGQMVGVNEHVAEQWFKIKRDEQAPLYTARAIIPCRGPWGKYLRAREYARSRKTEG